jgi:argininosuccinate lyase
MFGEDGDGLSAARHRFDNNPLGSAVVCGTPGLDIDRKATTKKPGFAVTQVPVTAVQLSRGKGESALLFELTLVVNDLAWLAGTDGR